MIKKMLAVLPLLISLWALPARAQELNCVVTVTTENVTITDQSLLAQMKRDIEALLNTQRWTNLTYGEKEQRIQCRMFIGINAIPQNGTYQATMRLLSTRPIYGTGYETNVISIVDKNFIFAYQPNTLAFSPSSFTSNLASLLGFYANIVVGLDRDTFGRLGGTSYYDQARTILTYSAAPSISGEPTDDGWKDNGSRNRYQFFNNITDPQLEPFRLGLYAYYRQGMDVFIEKPDQARAAVLGALSGIQKVAVLRVGAPLFRYFFDAKADEIANIFRTSPDEQQKQQVVAMLSDIDATNSAKYQSILKR